MKITVAEMKKICSDCAKMMVESNITEIDASVIFAAIDKLDNEGECPEDSLDPKEALKIALELDKVEAKVAGPDKVSKYYDKCMKKYDDQEYCARVAWSIYCSHVNPDYKGCTKYGKKWGKPYSSPVAK